MQAQAPDRGAAKSLVKDLNWVKERLPPEICRNTKKIVFFYNDSLCLSARVHHKEPHGRYIMSTASIQTCESSNIFEKCGTEIKLHDKGNSLGGCSLQGGDGQGDL